MYTMRNQWFFLEYARVERDEREREIWSGFYVWECPSSIENVVTPLDVSFFFVFCCYPALNLWPWKGKRVTNKVTKRCVFLSTFRYVFRHSRYLFLMNNHACMYVDTLDMSVHFPMNESSILATFNFSGFAKFDRSRKFSIARAFLINRALNF